MQIISELEVVLTKGEQVASDAFERYLDEGMGIDDAVDRVKNLANITVMVPDEAFFVWLAGPHA